VASDSQSFVDGLPVAWYNLAADLPQPAPPMFEPSRDEPLGPSRLAAFMPVALAEQEFSTQRWIEIPPEVLEAYRSWRPTPLVRAVRLEKYLRTPARIYFKDESRSPPGSHKLNTAVAQAYYAKQQGLQRLVTESGAGQWGCSLAMACSMFGLSCKVFMVNLSCQQRPYRRTLIRLWGGEVVASPSLQTAVGRRLLARDQDFKGSIGIAIAEAVENALGETGAAYGCGSVYNYTMLHQTVIGLETAAQLAALDEKPDVIIGCIGGGSNFAGLAFPFVTQRLAGQPIRFLAAEPRACPTLTRGRYRYDHTDAAGLTPRVKMHTLGHTYIPRDIYACGLRYHGCAPLVSHLVNLAVVEPVAFSEAAVLKAAQLLAATEGIIAAPESAYAVRAAITEAVRCRKQQSSECIVFCLSGHGLCDMEAYGAYLSKHAKTVAERPSLVDLLRWSKLGYT